MFARAVLDVGHRRASEHDHAGAITGPTSTDTGTTRAPTSTGDEPTTGGPWELGACNPIDPALRILPCPSLFHRREAETPTGWRVAFPTEALPLNSNMVEIDPVLADVALTGTIGHENLAEFADEGAKTMLLDVETGERVQHWIELDMRASSPAARLVVMRRALPLRPGKRHGVGVRGLQTTMGAPVAVSPAFAALRDDAATSDGSVEGQRA